MQTITPNATNPLDMLVEPGQRSPALPQSGTPYYYTPPGTLFHDIVVAVRNAQQAPPLLCVQAALGIGALALQDKVTVERPNDGKQLPTSLMVIGIAKSGERKSAVLDEFLAPVMPFLATHEAMADQARERYFSELDAWEKTRKRLLTLHAQAEARHLTGGEENTKKNPTPTLQQVKDALEKHEAKKLMPKASSGIGVLSDATPQAIPKFIKERDIRSLGLISAEGEEILTNGIKHKSSMLNKSFSGEATQRYRVGEGNQSYSVPITTCLFVQPEVAEQAFGQSNAKMRGTGTLARALVSQPLSTQGNRFLYAPDTAPNAYQHVAAASMDTPKIKKRYRRFISDMLNQSRLNTTREKTKLKLSREACSLWYQAFNECEAQLNPGGRYEHLTDHASKLPENWLRVAAIIHCYNEGLKGEISGETLRIAISLVNTFSSEFSRLFAPVSKEDKHLFSLRKYLEDKRQQNRYLPKKVITANGPVRPVSALDVALNTLHQRGEIKISQYARYNQNGKATRPITVIDLYPYWIHNQQEFQQVINTTYHLDQL